MSLLDLVLVLVGAAAGAAGWVMGFISRLFSWLGLAVGIVLVSLVLPTILERLDHIEEQWLLVISILLMMSGAMVGQALGVLVGDRLRLGLHPRFERLDAAGGACMGVLGVAALVWLLAPAVRAVPGWSADQVEGSGVVSVVEAVAPEPPDTFRTLRRIVGVDQFPEVFAGPAPGVEVGEPPKVLALDQTTVETAGEAVVRVHAVACSQRQDGTGFFVAPGRIVTNAHVVAGSENVRVFTSDGREAVARVVGYDPDRDLALLDVEVSGVRQLAFVEAEAGDVGAVIGHPRGGDRRAAPVEIAERVRARGRDLYDDHETSRQVYFLAAELEPGDSGAPVLDPAGGTVGVVFAIAPDDSGVAFALTALEVETFLGETDPNTEAWTQDCI